MAIRNLLLSSKLHAFRKWVVGEGYIERPSSPNAIYEVLRIEKYDPSGNNPHLVFYQRTHDGKGRDAKNHKTRATHITIPDEAEGLVRRFLGEQRNVQDMRKG